MKKIIKLVLICAIFIWWLSSIFQFYCYYCSGNISQGQTQILHTKSAQLFSIFYKDSPIGIVKIAPHIENGLDVIHVQGQIKFILLNQTYPVTLVATVTYKKQTPLSFNIYMDCSGSTFTVCGKVFGERILLTTIFADEIFQHTLPKQAIDSLQYLYLPIEKIKRKRSIVFIDPLTLQRYVVDISLKERLPNQHYLLSALCGNIHVNAIVNRYGHLQEATILDRWHIRRFVGDWDELSQRLVELDILEEIQIPATDVHINDKVNYIVVRLHGLETEVLPTYPCQKLVDTAYLQITPWVYHSCASRIYLHQDLLVQIDKDIENLSRQLQDKSPTTTVKRIIFWMQNNIKQKPFVYLPISKRVLERRYGDCNDYAVLFAALARCAKIPTKLVFGLVYLDGAFYYHSWNEVYIDGMWYGVDAILNEFPASCLHIKFAQYQQKNSMLNILYTLSKIKKVEIIKYGCS